LWHPSKFQRVSSLALVTAATSLNGGQPNFARFWPSHGLVHYIYIFGGGVLSPDGILPSAKFTLRPSLAFSYIGSVTSRHSSSGHQPNCGVVRGMELQNFRRGCHLYSAGRPSRWGSAHILVLSTLHTQLECGPMANLMVALPNICGALCSTPQSLADAHY